MGWKGLRVPQCIISLEAEIKNLPETLRLEKGTLTVYPTGEAIKKVIRMPVCVYYF